jgi:hypothetical protein
MSTEPAKPEAKSRKNDRLTNLGRIVFIHVTSLLSVSTAGRGAASSEAAPAFFSVWPWKEEVVL